MRDRVKIADEADVIICGYAIQRCKEGIRVVNINQPEGHVAVFREDGKLIETDMDDIEARLSRNYMLSAKKYMEEQNAEVL